MTEVPSTMRRIIQHIGPIIEDRLEKEKLFGKEWEDSAVCEWLPLHCTQTACISE